MRRSITVALAGVAFTTSTALAQTGPSASDFAAWGAMMFTPIGAFAPMSAGPAKGAELGGNRAALRVSNYKMTGEQSGHMTIGGSYVTKVGTNAVVNGTLGYQMDGNTGGENTIMLGADVISPLWAQPATAENNMALTANLQGSLGFGKEGGDNGVTAMSLAVGVPVGMTIEQASKAKISLFLTPGFGFGRLSATGGSESGTRPFFGLGGEWTSPAGWALHLGIQKVMIDNGPTNLGAGFNYKLGQ
jgi:hypothetical protein